MQIVEGDVFMSSDRDYSKILNLEIAAAFRELGDCRAEAKVYQKLLRTMLGDEPDYWVYRLSLARCEGELRRFDDARESIESIVKSAPSSEMRASASADLVSLRYSIACRDEAGDYATSIRELESLLGETSGDDAFHSDVLLLLGHACVESKRFAEAKRYYRDLANSATSSKYRNAASESIALLPKTRTRRILQKSLL